MDVEAYDLGRDNKRPLSPARRGIALIRDYWRADKAIPNRSNDQAEGSSKGEKFANHY
jgi:hypothetical protein